jgi:hypothetical protein
LCYAKIAPAALQRDIFTRSGQENSEAVGRLPKSAFGDSVRAAAGLASSIAPTSRMACC